MQRAFLSRFDWPLFIGAVFLVVLGLLSIASSSEAFGGRALLQLVIAFFGIAALFVAAAAEYRTLSSYAAPLYGLGIALLVAVLLFGVVRNSARSWFDLGFTLFQPSEPMKLAFILMLATVFARRARHGLGDVVRSALLLLPVLLLVLRQPDFGTALVFIAIWFVMLLGLHLRRRDRFLVIVGALVGAAAMLGAIFAFSSADSYQVRRLHVFPDHFLLRDVRHADIGYQVDQALVAIGESARFFGTGLGKGTQVHLGFLPAADTDFIFAAIAEELGLFGILLLLALYVLVLFRLLRIAQRSIDSFGSFLALGVFAMLFFHLLENVGMNLGLMPVTGVPLLLVSAGGSHLLTSLVALGIVESVSVRSQKIKY